MYAHVANNTITETRGALPATGTRLDNGNVVLGFPNTDTATQQACGWYQITDTPQPTPAAGDTLDRSVQLVNGTPTVVWTERPMTADELAAQTAQTNRAAIVTNLTSDMVAIQAMLDATNATINANPASFLKPIGRMLRRLGREALNDFTGST